MAIEFLGYGGNVIGQLGSGSLVQNMPSAYSFGTYDLDYAGSFVDCGDRAEFEFPAAEGHILSAWVKMAKFSDHQFIAGKANWAGTSHSEYFIGMNNDGRFHWVCNNGTTGGTCQSNDVYNNAVDKEGWNHIMGVRDTSNNMTLYINGVAQTDTETCTGDVGVSSQDFGIGTRNNGGTPDLSGDYWRGNIRDVRIYSGSATANELQEIFKGESPTLAGGSLVGWWKMNGNFNDSSVNGFNGVLTTGSDSTDYWDASVYNLNQIGAGSVSGSVTLSGGTWNLRDSTYLDFNGTSGYASVPSAASLDEPKTIAFWCRPDAIQTGANNIVSRGANDYEIYFHSSTNTWWNYWGTRYSTGADGPPVGVGVWQHIVCTLDDTTSPPTVRWYKDGTLYNTDPLNATPAYGDDGVLNIGRDATEENDYFDGIIKDLMLYDTKLTDTQVDLLYKGQWVGSPQHWWKLNEGTGNGEDSGVNSSTAQTNSTTWVNPDYDIEMDSGGTPFMIEEGATLSAPRGNLVLSGTTTTPTYTIDGIYTHNSGTMIHRNAVDNYFQPSDITKSGVNTFHKLKVEGQKTQWNKGSWNVEDSINLGGIMRMYANSTHSEGHTLTLGTTSAKGYVSGSAYLQAMTTVGTPAGSIVQGASTLYPALLSGTHATYKGTLSTYRSAQLGNLQFDGKVTNEGSMDNPVVTLINDVYFKGGYDVHNGEKLVTTNQRAQFGASLDMESGVTLEASGSLLICDDKIKTDGATVYNSGTSVICGHAGTSTIRFNEGDWENFMYNPTGGGVSFDTNANVANNLIIAGGYYDMTTTHLSGNGVGTLQIVGGGEFRGGDSTTHKITDTFNMAGGLLGTSALDLNGSSESAANASPTTWGFDSTFSIEFWFNTTFNGSSQLLDMAESSGNGNRIQVLQTPSEMAFKLYNAGGSSYQIGTTAFTINPDDGKWHHLAFTTDGSTQKIYYDGRLAGEASHTITRDTDPTTKLTVGMHATLGGNFFGKIDELRFFSDVRTVGELRTDMFQGGTLADSGALVARYKFDEGYDTTIASTVGAPARNLTASGDGVWIAPGTFTYETCTLKFDKAGTCNLTGHQDGNATNMYSVHITNGTTVEANCRNNDLIMNSGSLMTNSGTLNSNRNWQYKSRNMPIVGASSDLVVGNNIWYYMSDGSGLPVSGAGTNYYQLRPATQVWMQGDFDCQNGLLQSGGDLHLNGHTCSTSKIWNYGGGNLHAEPGSSIVFDNADGFNVSYGENPTTMFFVASGENALLPNGNTRSRGNYFYTDAGPSTADGGAFGDSGSRKMSVSMWFKTRKDDNNADFGSLECVLGGNRGSSGEGSPMFTNYASTVIEARMHTSDPGGGGLGRAADVTVSSLSLDTWYHLLFTSEETGGDVVQNLYIHNADGTIFNTDTATGTGKTWNISNTGYEDWWIWGKDNRGTSNSYYMGHGMAMADVRLYDAILTSGNSDTLSTECPNISPSYADPANDLGAITQWKLGPIVAPYQTSSYTDSVGSVTLTPTGNAYGDSNYKQPKSGFVIINGTSTPFNPINNLYPAGVTLINTYISGSKDIIVGQRKENSAGFMAVPSQTLTTKGKVTLE